MFFVFYTSSLIAAMCARVWIMALAAGEVDWSCLGSLATFWRTDFCLPSHKKASRGASPLWYQVRGHDQRAHTWSGPELRAGMVVGAASRCPRSQPNCWAMFPPTVQLPCLFRNSGLRGLSTTWSVLSFSFWGCEVGGGAGRGHVVFSIHSHHLENAAPRIVPSWKNVHRVSGLRRDRQFVGLNGVRPCLPAWAGTRALACLCWVAACESGSSHTGGEVSCGLLLRAGQHSSRKTQPRSVPPSVYPSLSLVDQKRTRSPCSGPPVTTPQ